MVGCIYFPQLEFTATFALAVISLQVSFRCCTFSRLPLAQILPEVTGHERVARQLVLEHFVGNGMSDGSEAGLQLLKEAAMQNQASV